MMDINSELDELQKKKGYILTEMEILKLKYFNVQKEIVNIMNKQMENKRIVDDVLKRGRNESV